VTTKILKSRSKNNWDIASVGRNNQRALHRMKHLWRNARWLLRPTKSDFKVLNFGFSSPHPPPSSAGWSGDFGEHCLSTWPRSGSCELRSRLTRRATQGIPKGWRIGVAFSWVTFFLAKQKKVTSCRATPGEVFCHSCFDRLSTNGLSRVRCAHHGA